VIFSSLDFLLFFIFILFSLKILENKTENSKKILLLIASYYFYAYWDWRFAGLIVLNTAVSYLTGKYIYSQGNNVRAKKLLLSINIITSLGILAVFKYYNFFIESLDTALSLVLE